MALSLPPVVHSIPKLAVAVAIKRRTYIMVSMAAVPPPRECPMTFSL